MMETSHLTGRKIVREREDLQMKVKKLIAGVLVAALAFGAAPVSSVRAADGVPIDEAHFPDAVFRSWVSEHCDGDGNGTLSYVEDESTRTIDVKDLGISSLEGIENFRALRTLECQGNQLTTLYVSENTALEQLICYSNQLTTLDVSKNTALIWLNCNDNRLTKLDVSKNKALEQLYCNDNHIRRLDLPKAMDCGLYGNGGKNGKGLTITVPSKADKKLMKKRLADLKVPKAKVKVRE